LELDGFSGVSMENKMRRMIDFCSPNFDFENVLHYKEKRKNFSVLRSLALGEHNWRRPITREGYFKNLLSSAREIF